MNPVSQSMTVKQAIQAIVNINTLPCQIDMVPREMRKRAEQAEKELAKLPFQLYENAQSEIIARIDEYYEPTIVGRDGNVYSAADMNNMF
jgi:uncharacterized protein (UPF0147 family)